MTFGEFEVADPIGGAIASPPADPPTEDYPVFLIQPSSGGLFSGFGEAWSYRELLVVLMRRDVGVRYKQTVLGAGWAILQPLMTMAILSFVFGYVARMGSEGVPFPIFVLSGLLPWMFFAQAFSRTGSSLVANGNLLGKVYFPRLIIPFSAVLTPLVDFAFASAVLVALMAWHGIVPGWGLLAVPPFLALACATALGCGLWVTSLDVRYRDIGHLVPFLIQTWMYATPVGYPAGAVPARWRALYHLNPMAGVVEGFRWAILGTPAPDPRALAVNVATVAAIFLGGLAVFRRTEDSLADLI